MEQIFSYLSRFNLTTEYMSAAGEHTHSKPKISVACMYACMAVIFQINVCTSSLS